MWIALFLIVLIFALFIFGACRLAGQSDEPDPHQDPVGDIASPHGFGWRGFDGEAR